MDIRFITAEEALPVRHQVLWPEKPLAFCRVEGDDKAIHFGVFQDDKLVSVASIYLNHREARLRKFATRVAYQKHGIGTALLQHIIDYLIAADMRSLWCDARESALPFYQRQGFTVAGPRFCKSTIPYYRIEWALSPTKSLEER